ncbi:valine--pyruvate transaminase [Streptomyces ficellus]|uniref:Valine--pyruvate transaminase n=1 Tax=Streptomyces ficellus TaxID=1977088 RepID=A0ABT7Z6C6_9ACTN|nr:valine--pyruvate transaminase [Streptomyces ficellus]MDN3295053.1 valine--pyruvate transaminase [Streptomyces ficellus]
MGLSLSGTKMAKVSGLRSIMEDIATTTSHTGGDAGWLNLSIGNPALIPEVQNTWQRLTADALADDFTAASCQYGPSRGAPVLVDAIVAEFNARYGWGITAENVVIGPGSQMLCFIAAALFTGPAADGTQQIVLPMTPDYTGYQGLCMHSGGIAGIPPRTEPGQGRSFRYAFDFDALEQRGRMGMMLLSSPSNPTGRSIDSAELARLIGVARRRDVPLIIDHAYGAPFPQIAATATAPPWDEHVINCFTLSKAGLPGERIGFAIGPAHHINAMVSFLSNSALHAPQLAQTVAARALTTGRLQEMAASVISPFYRNRRQTAEKLLAELLPEDMDWRLHSSEGGMFCWLWVNHAWFDDMALYRLLKTKNVFIVPGRHFFVDPLYTAGLLNHGKQCFRISLSADESVIGEGIVRIAEALRELRGAS